MPADSDANLNVRLDRGLKTALEAVLHAMGATTADTIRCFLIRVVNDGTLPFEPWLPNDQEVREAARVLDQRARTRPSGGAVINIRVDRRLKAAADATLRAAGITTSHALRCLFLLVVRERSVPFPLWRPTDAEVDAAARVLERGRQLNPRRARLFEPSTIDDTVGCLRHQGPARTVTEMTHSPPTPGAAMNALDTNVLVRLLTGDDARQTSSARDAVTSAPTWIPLTVFLEAACVLRTGYDFDDRQIAGAFRRIAGLPLLTVEQPHRLAQALDLVDAGVEIADAFHLAASASHCNAMLTFDSALLRDAGDLSPIRLLAP